jgi:twitching motility protein PilT
MDISEILKEVVARDASDLHLSVGIPPIARIDGQLQALDYPVLDPNTTRELIYGILTQDQRQKLETDWEVDLAYSL